MKPATERHLGEGDDLPGWARRGVDAPTVEVMDDDMEMPREVSLGDDKNLPAWALKGLQK